MLGCALSKTAAQLIAFRACQGIAISLCLTTAVGIISGTFPPGPSRTFAFASLGAGQPLGYAIGLVLGGMKLLLS
jgi:MFS family permease